jgi:peptide/nickel transport system ATP-binding protein
MSGDRPILQVEGLRTHFFTRKGVVKAVDDVSFALRRGEIMGLVGESGAGKSITGFSILRLIDPPGRIVAGRILLDGEDLLAKSEAEMAAIRGERIGMVFQDPQTSLDPVFSIGYQIGEALAVHHPISSAEGRRRAVGMLRRVGIPSPEDRLDSYPHQFSGGMRQRVVISIAMAGDPALLIADEPTTALDVTIQAQVLTLMRNLCRERGAAMILITHDMALVGQCCDQIAVMYAGHLVERGPTEAIVRAPRHPYTQGLLGSIPGRQARRKRLAQIPGMMPNLIDLPEGCPFRPRCDRAQAACGSRPPLAEIAPGQFAACVVEGRR